MLNVKVYPDRINCHFEQIYSGLYDLAKKEKITLEVTSRIDERIKASLTNSVLCIQVSDSENGQSRTVGFDMFDGCEISSPERLKLCDVYFKRSYFEEYINALDVLDRKKILPYGLNFECSSRNQKDILKRLILFHSANDSFFKSPAKFFRDFSRDLVRDLLLKHNIQLLGLKPISTDEFLVGPGEPAETKILFQTRLWTPADCPRISEDQLREINDMRVDTLRSLKEQFGERFVGGLVPNDLARQNYPELCATRELTKRVNYIDVLKKCLICDTTTGLHDSIGFKVPEYLAASRCIVTEPLKYQLPVPLTEGKNYLSFRTPEECVLACERLLSDPEFADQMRHENYKYYLNEVEPSELIYRCLESAMNL